MRSGLVTAAIIVAACLVPEHAPAAIHAAPPAQECQHDPAATDAAGPGDLVITADGTWFECVCEMRVFTVPDCGWYEILQPARDPQRARRIPLSAKRTHRLSRPVLITKGVRL
jgi:hypothetical protein